MGPEKTTLSLRVIPCSRQDGKVRVSIASSAQFIVTANDSLSVS